MKEKKANAKVQEVKATEVTPVEVKVSEVKETSAAVTESKVENAVKDTEDKAAKVTKKAVKKTAEKKATKEKVTKEKAAEKKEEKKAATDKKAAKKADNKTDKKIDTKVLFQFSGNEIDPDALLKQAKVQYVAAGGTEKDIKKMELYIKPEDNAAYYVVNGIPAGKVVIFA